MGEAALSGIGEASCAAPSSPAYWELQAKSETLRQNINVLNNLLYWERESMNLDVAKAAHDELLECLKDLAAIRTQLKG